MKIHKMKVLHSPNFPATVGSTYEWIYGWTKDKVPVMLPISPSYPVGAPVEVPLTNLEEVKYV